MNRSTFGLFLLILASAVVASSTPTSGPTPAVNSCLSKNKFLEEMNKGSQLTVTIFEEPKKDLKNTYCAAEWNKHGTCCDSIDLVNLFNFEKDTIDGNSKALVNPVGLLHKNLQTYKLLPEERQEKAVYLTGGFSKEANDCVKFINMLRGSALCSVCSGRSQVFFTPEKDKLLISPTTCSSTIEQCKQFFHSISWMNENIEEILGQSRELAIPKVIKEVELLKEKLGLYSPPAELTAGFMTFKDAEGRSSRRILAAYLCSMIVSVRKKPFTFVEDKAGEARLKKVLNLVKTRRELPLVLKQVTLLAAEAKRYHEAFILESKIHASNLKEILSLGLVLAEQKKKEAPEKARFNAAKKVLRDATTINRKAIMAKIKLEREGLSDLKTTNRRLRSSNWRTGGTQSEERSSQSKSGGFFQGNSQNEDSEDSEDPESTIFFADSSVLIMPDSDNMFHAFEGAPGTTLFTDNSVMKTMNCSMKFP